MDVSDFIELVQFGTTRYRTTAYAQYQNVASARLQGFELESMYDARLWFAGLSATVTEGKDTADNSPLSSIQRTMWPRPSACARRIRS